MTDWFDAAGLPNEINRTLQYRAGNQGSQMKTPDCVSSRWYKLVRVLPFITSMSPDIATKVEAFPYAHRSSGKGRS